MAKRRRHSILLYGPEETARRTIEHLRRKAEEARVNPEVRREWANDYVEHMIDYAINPERTAEAERKLEKWYKALEKVGAPKISRAMAETKAEYYKMLAEDWAEIARTSGYTKLGEKLSEESGEKIY